MERRTSITTSCLPFGDAELCRARSVRGQLRRLFLVDVLFDYHLIEGCQGPQDLLARVAEFGMKVDREETVRQLARKSKGIVRYAMAGLTAALSTADQRLTQDRVLRFSADPLWE